MEPKIEPSMHYVKNYINTIFAIAVVSLVFALKPADLLSWQSWLFAIGIVLLSALVLLHAWWRQVELMSLATFSSKRMLFLSALRVALAILFVYSVRSLAAASELNGLSVLPYFTGMALLFIMSLIVQGFLLKPLYGKIRAMLRREILTDWLLLFITIAAFALVFLRNATAAFGLVFYGCIALAAAARLVAVKATHWKELPPPHRGGRPPRNSRDRSRNRGDRSSATRQRTKAQTSRDGRNQGGRQGSKATPQGGKRTEQPVQAAAAGRKNEPQVNRSAGHRGRATSQSRRSRPAGERSTAQERINQKHRSTSPLPAADAVDAKEPVAQSKANTRPQPAAKKPIATQPPAKVMQPEARTAKSQKNEKPADSVQAKVKERKETVSATRPRTRRSKSTAEPTPAKSPRKPSRSRKPRASKAASEKAEPTEEFAPVAPAAEAAGLAAVGESAAVEMEPIAARKEAAPEIEKPVAAPREESAAPQPQSDTGSVGETKPLTYGRKAIRKGPRPEELDRLFREALERDAGLTEGNTGADALSLASDAEMQKNKKMLYGRKPRKKQTEVVLDELVDEAEDDAAAGAAKEDSGEDKHEDS